jgi:hypothetical protein
MQPRLNQTHIKNQLCAFLASVQKEVETQIAHEEKKPVVNHATVKLLKLEIADIKNIISLLKEGHCSGFSSLWLYCSHIDTVPRRFDNKGNFIPRDDLSWFKDTLTLISNWNRVRQLTSEEKNDFFRFISLLRFFQAPEDFRIPQGKLSETLQDTRGRKFKKEYSIAADFTKEETKNLLSQIIYEKRLILISSHDHDMGIIKCCGIYRFYNPNNPEGAVDCANTEELASAIFTASRFISDRPSPLGFRIFCTEETKKISPMNYPVQQDIIRTLSFIKDKKIDLAYKEHRQRTALHTAAFISCNKSLRALLDEKADPNVVDENQWTALMLSACNNNKKAVKRLIKHKANIETFSTLNKNALMLASEKGHTDTAVTLIRLGANTKTKPPSTENIFALAETNGYKECAGEMQKAVKEVTKKSIKQSRKTIEKPDATSLTKRRKHSPQQEPKYDSALFIGITNNNQTSRFSSAWNIFSLFTCCRRKKESEVFDKETLSSDETYKIV